MFCSKCGKEMPDDAVICTGCGCLLKKDIAPEILPENGKPNQPQSGSGRETQSEKIAKILFTVSLVLFGITELVAFYFSGMSWLLCLLSLFLLGSAIAGFVFSNKQKSDSLKYVSRALFVVAIVLFLRWFLGIFIWGRVRYYF